jgi:hypothetical protein
MSPRVYNGLRPNADNLRAFKARFATSANVPRDTGGGGGTNIIGGINISGVQRSIGTGGASVIQRQGVSITQSNSGGGSVSTVVRRNNRGGDAEDVTREVRELRRDMSKLAEQIGREVREGVIHNLKGGSRTQRGVQQAINRITQRESGRSRKNCHP